MNTIMKNKFVLLLTAVLLCPVLSLADDTIKIGVFEPMTGATAAGGAMEKEVYDLANELYPEVLGKKVELVYGDMLDLTRLLQTLTDALSLGGLYALIAIGYTMVYGVLPIEQNANAALRIADYGYVLETGVIALTGTGEELLTNESVREAYLGKKRKKTSP